VFSYDMFDTGMRWRYRAKITQTQAVSEVTGVRIKSAAGDRLLLDTVVMILGTVSAGRTAFGDLRDVSDDIPIEQLIYRTSVTSGQIVRSLKSIQSNAGTTTVDTIGKINDNIIISGDDSIRVGISDLAQDETVDIVLSGWVEHTVPTVSALGANQTTAESYNKTV